MFAALRLPLALAATAAFSFGLTACLETGSGPQTAEELRAFRLTEGAAKVADCAATHCTRLDLDGTLLRDYTVLSSMTHVTALMISYTDFSDLADIAAMPQLTELHIGDTDVAVLVLDRLAARGIQAGLVDVVVVC